jgi:hypothetical protein
VSDPFWKLGLTRWLAGVVCAADLPRTSCFQPVAPSAFDAIEHEISLKPIGSVRLRLYLASGVTGANRAIETDMSAGIKAEAGRYKGSLEFQMTGDWVILLHVTLPDGKKLERQIDVRRVRPNKASC